MIGGNHARIMTLKDVLLSCNGSDYIDIHGYHLHESGMISELMNQDNIMEHWTDVLLTHKRLDCEYFPDVKIHVIYLMTPDGKIH